MKRFWLTMLSLVLATTAVAAGGCEEGVALAQPGTLAINVTDTPPRAEITSVIITLSRVEAHKAAPAEEEETEPAETVEAAESEWVVIEAPADANTFDLLEVKGIEQFLASAELAPGKYTQVRLSVDKAEVALGGQALQPATVPGGKLRFIYLFEIVSGETTTLTIDFDAEKSVTLAGDAKILVRPVVKLSVRPPKGRAPQEITEGFSQKVARHFVRNGATFKYDGIADTLARKESTALSSPGAWEFTYEFDSQHAGYGDRTGQTPAQAITRHVEVVTVEDGNVTSAVIDGAWNEMTQQPIAAD